MTSALVGLSQLLIISLRSAIRRIQSGAANDIHLYDPPPEINENGQRFIDDTLTEAAYERVPSEPDSQHTFYLTDEEFDSLIAETRARLQSGEYSTQNFLTEDEVAYLTDLTEQYLGNGDTQESVALNYDGSRARTIDELGRKEYRPTGAR
jgi:hypothetical protein